MNPTFEMTRAWRLASAPLRKLPDFIIAGAPKCGTSSLYDLIALHPRVRRGWRKEPTNFIHYPTSALRSRMYQPFAFGDIVSGEGSVEYFFHPSAPANAAAIVPGARILFLVRDPVVRAWSDYRMFVKSGHEKEEFGVVVKRAIQWLSDPDAAPLRDAASKPAFNPLRYVLCGMYADLIARWQKFYPPECILVHFAEDLFSTPAEIAISVYSFLQLPPFVPRNYPHARDGGSKPPPPADAVADLRGFYQSHDARLREMLGCKLPWDHAS